MKKALFLAILAVLLISLSGCCARNVGGSGWGRSLVLPPILTIVLTNNTNVPLEVYENGVVVKFRNPDGTWRPAQLASGGTISRGYYNYLGRRSVVITVRGVCPKGEIVPDRKAAGCTSGQYAGTDSRQFYIYTDGQYHTEEWTIDYLRGPRGVY